MSRFLRQFAALVFAAVAGTAGAQSTLVLGPYQYDASGNVTGVGMEAQYRYDAYGRLKTSQISVNGLLHDQHFTYDRFGNILTIATGGTPVHLGVDSSTNRLTTGLPQAGIFGTHDDDGNMTSYIGSTTFEPDELGMVRRASLEGHRKVYLYTADDERIATIDLTPAGAEDDSLWTVRDLSGKVLREYRKTTANGEAWQWKEDYIYRGGALLAAEVPGNTLHFHPDHLGTPRLITDAQGGKVSEHTYAPFGVELTPAGNQRMKFTGHERDVPNGDDPTTGKALDYMHARYYTPGGGRFLTVDPSYDDLDLSRPQTWNKYVYVQNIPFNRIDPDGRSARETFFRLMKEVYNKAGEIAGFVPTRSLSKEGAIKARQAEKNVEVVSKSPSRAEKTAGEIEAAAHPGGTQKHHPAGTHGNSRSHHQTARRDGHTFYRTLAGIVMGLASPWYVDAATVIVEKGAPIAAEKGNEAIDNARKTATFGGERRGEATADELIEDQ
ncbi:MAG TPA: RHS repeat-associated core domain-containing protein [Thermoanaerobaculia bacterium]